MTKRQIGSVLATCFLVSLVAASAAERPPFPNHRFPTGTSTTRYLITADFNEDGSPDVAVAANDESVVMLGGSSEVFSSPIPFPAAGDRTVFVATADFDLDGHLDLATVGFSPGPSELTIALGNGDGTFDFKASYPNPDQAFSIAIADFDSDGMDDIVVSFLDIFGSPSAPGLAIRFGNGDGSFGTETVMSEGNGFFVAAARLDADAHWDLVVAGGAGTLVFLGDGAGGFAAPVEYLFGGLGIAIDDLDDDTVMDLVLSGGTGLEVALGNGDGTFATANSYSSGSNFITPAIVTDLGGDGVPDLVATDGPILIRHGVGDGTFLPALEYPTFNNAHQALAVADFDGDGKRDVAADSGFHVSLLYGNGDGTLAGRYAKLPESPHLPGSNPTGLVGDVDLDGFEDLSAGGTLFFGNADGTFVVGPGVTASIAGQFTSDGLPDLFGGGIWVNFGNRAFSPAPVPVTTTLNATIEVAVDLNGDSRDDLIGVNSGTNEVAMVLGVADATFGPDTRYPVGTAPSSMIVAHLNADAHLDLVVTNRDSGDLSVLLGNGGVSFQPAISYPVGAGPMSIASGDLNNDSAVDLVVVNEGSFDFSVLLGLGDGTFGPEIRYAFESNNFDLYVSGAVAVGDFNRDGDSDLMINGSGTGFWAGNGDGSFEPAVELGLHSSFIAYDFDNDGWLDLLSGGIVFFNLAGPGMLGFDADRATMRWPGVAGADTYSVYRGDTAGFTDVNLDGLPDGGYGLCLNGIDADPTDTSFTDVDVPSIGGDGFFYLRGVVTTEGEELGTTSAGVERIPDIPCP